MCDIVKFPKSRMIRRRFEAQFAGAPAQILLFTGVRYTYGGDALHVIPKAWSPVTTQDKGTNFDEAPCGSIHVETTPTQAKGEPRGSDSIFKV